MKINLDFKPKKKKHEWIILSIGCELAKTCRLASCNHAKKHIASRVVKHKLTQQNYKSMKSVYCITGSYCSYAKKYVKCLRGKK